MESVIKESTSLYFEIDDCITELLKARLDKDTDKEHEAICKMESLIVGTMQHLSWLVGELKGSSKIKWQTGEPKESDIYFVTTSSNIVRTSYWNNGCWLINDLPFSTLKIKAWCKLSDIEPYKEEKE